MKSTVVLPLFVLAIGCSRSPDAASGSDGRTASATTTTVICDQHWTTRNLEVTTYRNGDPIPQVTDTAAWRKLTTGAWCWYNNDSATYHRYGRLYNWYAVNDPRGLASEGWHVLTDADWEAMETCLGEDSVGYRLRAVGQWRCAATMIDNSSGFHGLPSGKRSAEGMFSHADSSAVYWTANEGSVSEAWCGRLIHNESVSGVPTMITGVGYMNKAEGYAVRCVKDR